MSRNMELKKRIVALCISIALLIASIPSFASSSQESIDKAHDALSSNPTEAKLIAYADLVFGKSKQFTAESPLPEGKNGLALLYKHPKYGSIVLITSKTSGNLYWKYDDSDESIAAAIFVLESSSKLFDIVAFNNGNSGTSDAVEGNKVTNSLLTMWLFDIWDIDMRFLNGG